MVKVSGESAINSVKCMMERISPQPRTVTTESTRSKIREHVEISTKEESKGLEQGRR